MLSASNATRPSLRYLFSEEIEALGRREGFVLKDCFEVMTGRQVSDNAWAACFIMKAVDPLE